jgi:hypothetical protein
LWDPTNHAHGAAHPIFHRFRVTDQFGPSSCKNPRSELSDSLDPFSDTLYSGPVLDVPRALDHLCPNRLSQMTTVLSRPPAASRLPSGLNATQVTSPDVPEE